MKIIAENLALLFKSCKYEFILGLCALSFAYAISTVILKAKGNFPPRVIGLPLVGYLPFMTKDMHLDFMKLGKKYGDVYSIKLGSQDMVILNGAEVITEAFCKSDFVARPPDSTFQQVFPSSAFFGRDLFVWKEQRRAVFQFMKDLGVGKKEIEENILQEINHFMGFLRNSETQPIDIRKALCFSIINNMCALIIGKRFEYDDPKLDFLYKNLEAFFMNFTQNNPEVLFPWIRYIPFATKFLKVHKTKIAMERYENFFLKEINEHLKTLKPDHIRDFVDRYLVEMKKKREKALDTSFNQNMLITNCLDIFLAANETVEAALLWSIYIIAAFPDVQKKVQKEILKIIGLDRTPEYKDIRNLPYTHAVMLEVMRWKYVVPLVLPRCASIDTTVGGYNLHKGTPIIANFWGVHHDPRYWDEPEKFKPERFLTEEGISVLNPSYFIPFSVGKRSCPGESLANLEFFLYFACILRDFDVSFPDKTEPTFNANFYTVYRPESYLVRFFPKT